MPTSTPAESAPKSSASRTALLIIDMISCWDFPDAGKLLPATLAITPAIAALKARCRRAGAPVVYANDNRGRWRSDFRTLVDLSLECGGEGARVTRALLPGEEDYFVLKPKHSAFFGTPTELLLQHLGVRRIVVTGVSSDQCVLVTASEARMRDLDVIVPRDCVASQTARRNGAALRQLQDAHKLPTTPGTRIRLANYRGGKTKPDFDGKRAGRLGPWHHAMKKEHAIFDFHGALG